MEGPEADFQFDWTAVMQRTPLQLSVGPRLLEIDLLWAGGSLLPRPDLDQITTMTSLVSGCVQSRHCRFPVRKYIKNYEN